MIIKMNGGRFGAAAVFSPLNESWTDVPTG